MADRSPDSQSLADEAHTQILAWLAAQPQGAVPPPDAGPPEPAAAPWADLEGALGDVSDFAHALADLDPRLAALADAFDKIERVAEWFGSAQSLLATPPADALPDLPDAAEPHRGGLPDLPPAMPAAAQGEMPDAGPWHFPESAVSPDAPELPDLSAAEASGGEVPDLAGAAPGAAEAGLFDGGGGGGLDVLDGGGGGDDLLDAVRLLTQAVQELGRSRSGDAAPPASPPLPETSGAPQRGGMPEGAEAAMEAPRKSGKGAPDGDVGLARALGNVLIDNPELLAALA